MSTLSTGVKKKDPEGTKHGTGDIYSELGGASTAQRTGNVLLGEKKSSQIAGQLDKLDLGRQILSSEGWFGEPKAIHAPGLSEQEKVIIARMKELSMGDPELGQMYSDFTLRALEGKEGVSPGLKRDIAEQEEILKEEIARGLGPTGDVASTPGIKRMGRFREKSNIVKERARQDAIRKGEGLMGSRSRRMVAAAGTALGPMAQQRGLEAAAQLQTAANVAGEKAGLMQLGGQMGGLAVTQYRRKN